MIKKGERESEILFILLKISYVSHSLSAGRFCDFSQQTRCQFRLTLQGESRPDRVNLLCQYWIGLAHMADAENFVLATVTTI